MVIYYDKNQKTKKNTEEELHIMTIYMPSKEVKQKGPYTTLQQQIQILNEMGRKQHQEQHG